MTTRLTAINIHQWRKELENKLLAFGECGLLLLRNEPFSIEKPQADGVIEGTKIRKYPLATNGLRLTTTVTREFHRDSLEYQRRLEAYREKEVAMVAFIVEQISPSALTTLQATP